MQFITVAAAWIVCLFTIDIANAQAIPYSYANGRDVEAVERRSKAFQEAKSRGATQSEIDAICGPVSPTSTCSTTVGRPKDSETAACDSACCQVGQKAGNCGVSFGVSLGLLGTGLNVTPALKANCKCSNDLKDIRCGPDGSLLGIRCPFDSSACWRKCCREGRSGGKCGGFLRTRCRCN